MENALGIVKRELYKFNFPQNLEFDVGGSKMSQGWYKKRVSAVTQGTSFG